MKAGDEAQQMVAWARKHGIQSTIHTGGPSIPGSGLIDKDVVLEADADIIGHINGGHTALPEAHVCELCETLVARHRDRAQRQRAGRHRGCAGGAASCKCPHRVILGTDGPAGSGVQPLGILRMVAMLSSLGGIPAELVFCFATGNTARIRKLELRADRAGPRGRLRLHGPRPAHRRQHAAAKASRSATFRASAW